MRTWAAAEGMEETGGALFLTCILLLVIEMEAAKNTDYDDSVNQLAVLITSWLCKSQATVS